MKKDEFYKFRFNSPVIVCFVLDVLDKNMEDFISYITWRVEGDVIHFYDAG